MLLILSALRNILLSTCPQLCVKKNVCVQVVTVSVETPGFCYHIHCYSTAQAKPKKNTSLSLKKTQNNPNIIIMTLDFYIGLKSIRFFICTNKIQ